MPPPRHSPHPTQLVFTSIVWIKRRDAKRLHWATKIKKEVNLKKKKKRKRELLVSHVIPTRLMTECIMKCLYNRAAIYAIFVVIPPLQSHPYPTLLFFRLLKHTKIINTWWWWCYVDAIQLCKPIKTMTWNCFYVILLNWQNWYLNVIDSHRLLLVGKRWSRNSAVSSLATWLIFFVRHCLWFNLQIKFYFNFQEITKICKMFTYGTLQGEEWPSATLITLDFRPFVLLTKRRR